MRDRKFVQLLATLAPEEERAFNKIVKGGKQQLQSVYNYCRKYYPDFSNKKFTNENCALKMKVSAKRLTNLFSELARLLEDFLIKLELEREENLLTRRYLLLEAHQRRNIDKFFFEMAADLKTYLEDQPEKDLEYHYHMFYLSKLIFRHPRWEKKYAETLSSLIGHLDSFCIGSMLKYQCLLGNLSDISPKSSPFMMPKLISDVREEAKFFVGEKLIELYFSLQESLGKPKEMYRELEEEEAELVELKDLILARIDIFAHEEQKNVMTWLINCCLKRYFYFQDSENRFLKIVLVIHKKCLEMKVWHVNGQILRAQFNSIFVIAMMVKELQWAKQFIKECGPDLNETNRENTLSFCLARIAFAEQEYEKAIALLEPFDQLNFYDYIYERVLLLKCYFELNEGGRDYFDKTDRLIASLERYLDRGVQSEKITKTFAAPFKNFVKFVRHIFAANNNKAELIAQLEAAKNVNDRNWLMEKITKM